MLEVPAATPWPLRSLFTAPVVLVNHLPPSPYEVLPTDDGGLVVASPGVIARFDAGESAPRWARQWPRRPVNLRRGRTASEIGRHIAYPGRFEPAMADGRLITRWELDRQTDYPRHVVALDLADGRELWSTEGQAGWARRLPVGDPVLADGRVYVLAAERGILSRVDLVALDAATGRMLWASPLMREVLEMQHTYTHDAIAIDLMAFGSGVAVADGAVYAQTNAGVVARLDARDGHLEWLHQYERVAEDVPWRRITLRRGGRPVLEHERVIFAPRDAERLIALDTQTGERAWRNEDVPSDWIVAGAGGQVVVAGGSGLAAVDTRTGEQRWRHETEHDLVSVFPLNPNLLLSTTRGVSVVDAHSGELLQTAELPFHGYADALGLLGDELAMLSPEPAGLSAPADDRVTLDGSGEGWEMLRSNPRRLAAEGDVALIESAGVLECVDLDAGQPVRWHRRVGPTLRDAVISGDGPALLVFQDTVMAVDMDSGDRLWRREIPFWSISHINNNPSEHDRYVARVQGERTLITMHRRLWHDYPLMMLDTSTGEVLWSKRNAPGQSLKRVADHAVVWGDETLYVLLSAQGAHNTLLPFDIESGEHGERQRFHADGQPIRQRSLTIMDDRWLFVDAGGRLCQVRFEAGKPESQWRLELPEIDARLHRQDSVDVHVSGRLAMVEQHRHGTWRRSQ